jgi:aminoglycoside phosphotransferase (APT) family kinase protein
MTREEMRRRFEQWLVARLPDAAGVKVGELHFASAGYSAETLFTDVSFTRDDSLCQLALVIRKQVEGLDLFLDSDLTVPYRVMQALQQHPSVPAPRAVGVELDREVLGSTFLVMEKVQGRVPPQKPPYPLQGWVKELSPPDRARLWGNAITTLAALHKLDWRESFAFLNRPGRGAVGFEQYLAGIEESYRWAAAGRPLPIIDEAMAYIRSYRPELSPPSVLWGDPQLCNIMFKDDLSVAAVLDWEVASLGPAEADFGWWLFFEDFYATATGVPRLDGAPDRAESTRLYTAALGRKVNDLEYYELLASLRMALVVLRSADRYVAFGKIPASSRAGIENPATTVLARKMQLPPPQSLDDYNALITPARHLH